MNQGLGMATVEVKRTDLLTRITQNRDGHRAIFEEAIQGYRTAVIKELDRMLDDAKQGREIRRAIGLVEPKDHTADYDRIITMLTMSINETVSLTQAEFGQYVMDDWGWKPEFTQSASHYR